MPGEAAKLTIERVLCAVECVPAGRVVSYGDVADLVGTSARRVGAIMGSVGAEVPWWRVTNAAGRLPIHLLAEASRHWQREGTPVHGGRCLMALARVDPQLWASDYAKACSGPASP
ncbi:MAG: MGMT family protein [Propionibacteriaceae bacterium]|nr:MGMT family protein [Propionibacteriaceae bacterium]